MGKGFVWTAFLICAAGATVGDDVVLFSDVVDEDVDVDGWLTVAQVSIVDLSESLWTSDAMEDGGGVDEDDGSAGDSLAIESGASAGKCKC